jgi:hypothetical protein
MAKSTEELLQDLIDILRPTGNSSGQDPDGKTKGASLKGGPAFVGSFADLEKSFKDLSTKLEEMAKAVGINTDAVKQIPAAILGYRSSEAPSRAFQDAADIFGKGVGNFVRHIDSLRQEAQKNTNVGIGEGDPVRQRARAQAAGYEDNAAMLKGVTNEAGNFRGSLAGLGYSANDATQKFLDYSEELRKDKTIRNLIEKNIITAADVPRLAMMAAQGQDKALDTQEGRDNLVKEMAKQATLINQISSAYGINRDKLIENSIAMNENNESQIRQAALGDDAARRAMKTAQTISTPSGESMEKLVAKLSSGARLSKEDRAMLSVGTMGMGGQLTSAVKDIQRTKNLKVDDPQRIAAEDNLRRVQAEIRARQQSPEANRLAQSMKEGTNRSVLEKAIEEGRPAARIEQKNRQLGGFTPEQAAKNAQENAGGAAARGQQQQFSGANPPKTADGAKVFQTISELTEAYSKNAAAATGALAKLNEQLGKNAEVIDRIKKVLTLPVGPNSESVKEKEANIQKPIDEIVKLLNPNGPSTDVRGPGMTPSGDLKLTTPNVSITSPNVTVTPTTPSNNAPAAPTMQISPTGTPQAIPVETRGTGTVGETGFSAEMNDVVAKLHKGETVLTPEQMKNLISGVGMMSASDTASAMLSNMTGTKSAGQSGGIDITKMFDSVNTNISSASKPESITSDIIYTGTLKALKEINGVTSPEPGKSESKTSLTVPAVPPINVAVPDIPQVKVADVKVPGIPPVNVAVADVKVSAIPQVKVADVKVPGIPQVKVADVKVPGIPQVKVADVKVSAIPPVTLTTPKPLTPDTSTNKTDSIIDKQLAKFGIDLGNLSGKLPSNMPTPATTKPVSISEIQKYMSEGMSQSDAQKKAEKTALATAPAFTSDVGIKKIFDSVSTTISSVTGGGSTTRKSVQNEDAKSAQTQLEALTSQYNKDRVAISNKISESMGPDTKRGDVLKELKVNPEAIALEARMKSMTSDLSNRIGAGTSVETTFESGIQRGNIVEKSATSVPITDVMKGFEPTPDEYATEEPDEKPQSINLNDSEATAKDLYDQLIQLNSSIRQLVEHSASGVDLAGAQIKATRGLSGNRFA